jgi:DNA-binding IclR family transcriptional regulator
MWDVSVSGSRRARGFVHGTGVGVLDRSVALLDAVEAGSRTFSELVEATGFPRTTTHRLLKALQAHELLTVEGGIGYRLGRRFLRLASTAMREPPLRDLARPCLERLAEVTGESAQLFVRSKDVRVCLDAVESSNELRTIVRPGAELPITAGSAGKVLMAWAPDRDRLLPLAEPLTDRTPTGDRLGRQLRSIRGRGFAESVGERQSGVASVSAPVFDAFGAVAAAVSVSGPVARLGPRPGRQYGAAVVAAAREIEQSLGVS